MDVPKGTWQNASLCTPLLPEVYNTSNFRKSNGFFMTEWSRGKMISFDCSSFKSWMSSVYIVLSLQQQHVQIETQKRNHFTFNHWHFPSLMNGCCSARFKKFPDHSKKVKHSWSTEGYISQVLYTLTLFSGRYSLNHGLFLSLYSFLVKIHSKLNWKFRNKIV